MYLAATEPQLKGSVTAARELAESDGPRDGT